jgi:hypothetical protein
MVETTRRGKIEFLRNAEKRRDGGRRAEGIPRAPDGEIVEDEFHRGLPLPDIHRPEGLLEAFR